MTYGIFVIIVGIVGITLFVVACILAGICYHQQFKAQDRMEKRKEIAKFEEELKPLYDAIKRLRAL